MELSKIVTGNTDSKSIDDLRHEMNELSLPFLQRNELGKYFRQYPEVKEVNLQDCKKRISEGIEHMLKNINQNQKCLIHPSQSRSKYVQLQKWLTTHLQSLHEPQTYKQLSTIDYIEEQKKLIITTFLQLESMFSLECKQKAQILKVIVTMGLQIVNTLLIELENTSANMLLGCLKEKNTSEKELIERISSLEKTIQILDKERNNKYTNLYVVVKDNRVLKKQNNKLIKLLNSEQEKVKILNEEHLKMKDENQKFKLFLSSDNQEETKKLQRYVQAKVQLNQIDKLIKLYPKQAQKIAYAELKNIEKSQLNTLQEKIAHIIMAIQKSGELIQQKDEGDDFLDTNKAKMSYNISTQTDKYTLETGINTVNKVLITSQTQVCQYLKSKHLSFVGENVSEKIFPDHRVQIRSTDKKKTKPSMGNLKMGGHRENMKSEKENKEVSIRDLVSEKKFKWPGDFEFIQVVNIKFQPEQLKVPRLKRKPSLMSRKDSLCSSSSSLHSERTDTKNIGTKVKFDEMPSEKKNKDIPNSSLKIKSKQFKTIDKKVARLGNMHTFSSKSKIKESRPLDSVNWKVNRTYNLSIQEQSKFSQNVIISTLQDRIRNGTVSKTLGLNIRSQKFCMTICPGMFKANLQEKIEDQIQKTGKNRRGTQLYEKQKNATQIQQSQELNQAIFQSSKQKKKNENSELKNNSKLSIVSNESKIAQKKNLTKAPIWKVGMRKRERQQSQGSLTSFSTVKSYLDNRQTFQQQLLRSPSRNGSIFKDVGNQQSVKKSSEFARVKVRNNIMKAKKLDQQASVFLNRLKNPNCRLMTEMENREQDSSMIGGMGNNFKHIRTRTQELEKTDDLTEEYMTAMYQNVKGTGKKDFPTFWKPSEIQNDSEMFQRPRTRIYVATMNEMQRPQTQEAEEQASSIDLIKSIQRVIKNISQRSAEIMKKDYLFKQFLLSYYQLHYGNGKQSIPKNYGLFFEEMKKLKYNSNPMVQCLQLLMNESCSEIYRREIFKLFTMLIEKNSGSLGNFAGDHGFYKKISTEILQIFIDSNEVQGIIKGLCLEQLDGNISDYFIAIEGQIRKRSVNSQLYKFLSQNILLYGESSVSFDLIKEIAFFMGQGNKRVKSQLIELRMYSEPFIELHRLCLIFERMKFTQFIKIGSFVDKKYNQYVETSGLDLSAQEMIKILAKQKFENFSCLKQILHRQIQNFYKYNIPISEALLKLCQINVLSQKVQNESPISDCLKLINEQSERLEILRYYKQVLENKIK